LADQLGTLYNLGTIGSLSDDQLLARFLARNQPAEAEAAFAALVDRHGPMVLSVCMRVLEDSHDAHDAFQATFLVLVRKAGSIRRRESVGGWLFGIARRVAVRARIQGERRRRHLADLGADRRDYLAGFKPTAVAEAEPDYELLIAEIDRLPEMIRTPVVLHYFEGLSTEATAERLGCPRGTVLSRLSRARERLRRRLECRGGSLEALMPATGASIRWAKNMTVPSPLATSTVRAAACLSLAGTAIDSVVPATVASLSLAVMRNLMFAKIRLASMLAVIAVASAAIGLTVASLADDQPPRAAVEARVMTKRENARKSVAALPKRVHHVRGQVLDPDGKPVVAARIVLGQPALEPGVASSPRHLTTSGADGRFEVTVPEEFVDPSRTNRQSQVYGPVIAALVPGFGPGWNRLDVRGHEHDLSLRLRRDDIPIEGRIMSLEGRPVAGATVHVSALAEVPDGFLNRLRDNAGNMNPALWSEARSALLMGNDEEIPAVRTGPDGRFRFTGVGRDRLIYLVVDGGSIEQSFALVLSTADPAYTPIALPGDGEGRLKGPRFDLTVNPGRMIRGVLRDRDTGLPVKGARVRSWAMGMATSDDRGRFSIAGQPKRNDHVLEVITEGQPYIKVEKSIGDSPGLDPIDVDVTLKRGTPVEGRVIDRATGRPVSAIVQYYPFRDNPHLRECPDASFHDNNVSDEAEFPTDTDGKFRAVVLAGSGLLTVRTSEQGFLTAVPLTSEIAGNVLHAANFVYQMEQYQALVPINIDDGKPTVIPDIALSPGRVQHVQIVGADGRPVSGTRYFGHHITTTLGELVTSAEFTFVHPKPGNDEPLLIVQQDGEAGRFVLLKGDEPDPIRVTLQPTATVAGRLVDAEGRPRANVSFVVMQDLTATRFERFIDKPTTDPDGRFRIKGLVPGVSYTIESIKNTSNYSERFLGPIHKRQWTVNSGENQDWGDVRVVVERP